MPCGCLIRPVLKCHSPHTPFQYLWLRDYILPANSRLLDTSMGHFTPEKSVAVVGRRLKGLLTRDDDQRAALVSQGSSGTFQGLYVASAISRSWPGDNVGFRWPPVSHQRRWRFQRRRAHGRRPVGHNWRKSCRAARLG